MRRITIARLMLAVSLCAVGMAALHAASDLWASIMLGLTLLVLGVSILGWLQRRGPARAFWQGFAVFGWGYVMVGVAPWVEDTVVPRLPTTWAIAHAHARIYQSTPPNSQQMITNYAEFADTSSAVRSAAPAQSKRIELVIDNSLAMRPDLARRYIARFVGGSSNYEPFLRIGHCLFTILAGLVGASICCVFYARQHREEAVRA
jgi:hypothetical protein